MREKLPIWDIYNKVMSLATNPTFAHNRFLFYNREILSCISKRSNFNYFLPRELGGLGLIPRPEIPYKITAFQHHLANYFARYYDDVKSHPVEHVSMLRIALVQANSPIIHQEFLGTTETILLDLRQPVPSDCFQLEPEVLPLSHNPDDLEPVLKYKFLPSSFLKDFRSSSLRSAKQRYLRYIDDYGAFSKRLVYKYTSDFYREYINNSYHLIDSIVEQSAKLIADLRQQSLLEGSSPPEE
jgi:hypothetical protein